MGRMKNLVIMAECASIDPQILVEDLKEAVRKGELTAPLSDEDIEKFIKEYY